MADVSLRTGPVPRSDGERSLLLARYRRRPDVVEAMQWNPSEVSMQDVLTWLRDESQVFKTVGRQLWIEFGDTRKSWMVTHPGDYVVRKTEGRRYFYVEAEKNFGEAREPLEAPSRIDAWGERLDAEALDAALEAAPQGSDWWFDGRDLFYKPAGTNLDQIIVPFPETWHQSQEVPQAVGRLIATAVNYLRAVRRGN